MSSSSEHPNAVWAAAMVDELIRNGVDQFCLAPGSRCTPLVEAVARHPSANAVSHFDERGVGFYALGFARATNRPAVVITTSGTAVANLLPAVIEAAQDRVPMIVLTADRPPELRATDANQTMIQPGLFDPYVSWSVDLPCPTEEIPIPFVLTTVDQACYRARRTPVHLNAMFREPLSSPLCAWTREGEGPWTTYAETARVPGEPVLEDVLARLTSAERGVVVAGGLGNSVAAQAVLEFAERLGWPLLPDVTSGLRLTEGARTLIPYYESLVKLLDEVDTVLHLGNRCVSKRLLEVKPSTVLHVADHPHRHDPQHQVTLRVEADVRLFCEQMSGRLPETTSSPWLARWKEADALVGGYLEQLSAISEPWIARHIAQTIPSGQGLFVASSMPVRDVNRFAPVRSGSVRIAANRGVSGIDGTVACVTGFAGGLRAPVTLLIGDLALLHDLNSLALVKKSPHPVIVVVINNDGGGIFHFLPVAERTELFEPYFGTPHGMSFADAAKQFGLPYVLAKSSQELADAYRTAANGPASVLIEIRSDRTANAALHRELDADIRRITGA